MDEPGRRDGRSVADSSRDLASIAVIERHRGTGRIGLGFVRGFGLRRAALASTHRAPPRAYRRFLALSVGPELKLTDRGLVDVTRFELVPVQA